MDNLQTNRDHAIMKSLFEVRRLLLLSGQSRDSEAFLMDDITTQTWTETSAALKIQTRADRKSNKENRQEKQHHTHFLTRAHTHTHTRISRRRGKISWEMHKGIYWIYFHCFVTFLGYSVCPICVGKTLLERGPWKKPVSPEMTVFFFFSLSTDPLNLCEVNQFSLSVKKK